MRVTVLSHDLSSNAVMRAHRLATAASQFADVRIIGPVGGAGVWPALPLDPPIASVQKARFPRFWHSFQSLVALADGDVLIAVKPHLASFGVGLVASEITAAPLILDVDDLDEAFAPRLWQAESPLGLNISRPGSPVYISLLTKASPAASAITVASRKLRRRFGGTLVPHGAPTDLFDPSRVDRDAARSAFGFAGPTVLFPGKPRKHKGIRVLAEAMRLLPNVTLAVTCRADDLVGPEWDGLPLRRLPLLPYGDLPCLLAAADVVAIPQLDTRIGRHQMPMKVFDAMAMGRPIVASAVSDLPRVLDGCGCLVPPGDPAQLARSIQFLLDHPKEAEALGSRARARCFRDYSTHRVAETLRKLVARLVPIGEAR